MAQPSLGPEPVDDSLHISVARSDHGPTIHLVGVLDGATSGAFSDVVAATAGRPCRQVTVSLAGVTFLDCRGLTALLRAQRLLKDTGIRLTLSAVPAHCLRLIDLADLRDTLDPRPAPNHHSPSRPAPARHAPEPATAEPQPAV
jgi:anti-sigma B factor antagonist